MATEIDVDIRTKVLPLGHTYIEFLLGKPRPEEESGEGQESKIQPLELRRPLTSPYIPGVIEVRRVKSLRSTQ